MINQTAIKQMSDVLLSREIARLQGWSVKRAGVRIRNTNELLYCLFSPSGIADLHAYLTENEAWLGDGLPEYASDLDVAITLVGGLDFELCTSPMRWRANIMTSDTHRQLTVSARCDSPARAVAEAWIAWYTDER